MLTEHLNLTEERKSANIFGVVIFIKDENGRVLTFKELETKEKTGKKYGDYSVLCETREPGEVASVNMVRGLHEELGIKYPEINQVLDLDNIRAWETGFMPGVWATVYVVDCKDREKLETIIGCDAKPDGVEIIGWKTKEEFMSSPIRVGVRNILDKFSSDIFDSERF